MKIKQAPNLLSILRGFLSLLVFILILNDIYFWALLIFILAALTDYFDGIIARRYNLITDFGKIIDPIADKMLILLCFAGFAIKGYVYSYLVIIIALREIIITALRLKLMRRNVIIPAQYAGKLKTTLQMGVIVILFLGISLLNKKSFIVISEAFFRNLINYLMFFLVFITVISGITYFRDMKNYFKPSKKQLKKDSRPINFNSAIDAIVSLFHIGYVPIGGGSLAALLSAIAYFFIAVNFRLYVFTTFIVIILGFSLMKKAEAIYNETDPPRVVIDEVAGMLVSFILIPPKISYLLIGFIIFRILDILKPFPADILEKKTGSNGIMWDDIVCGIYTCLVLHLIIFLFF
jgi:CDP-diacylglycerol--glycerol-3-phosphate 3-phosphatidyltransferase